MEYTSITSHEEACKVLNRDAATSTDHLKDIADAINFLDDDYKPDEDSWTPIFWWDNAGGFGFSDSGYDGWLTYTGAGARLCLRFRNAKISDFFGKQHEALHKKHFYS